MTQETKTETKNEKVMGELGLHAVFDEEAQQARIGNEKMRVVIDTSNGLTLQQWLHTATATDWRPAKPDFPWGTSDHHEALVVGQEDLWPDLAPPSREFQVRISLPEAENKTVSSLTEDELAATRTLTLDGTTPCRLVSEKCHAEVVDGRARLALTVAFAECNLEVTVHTEVPKDLPVLRRWVSVRNVGDQPLILHECLTLMFTLRPGVADLDAYWVEAFNHPCIEKRFWRQANVHQRRLGAAVRQAVLSGPYPRQQDASLGAMGWLSLRDPELAEGMVVGWEWSGAFDAVVGDFHEGAGMFGLRAGYSTEGGYQRTLAPGEEFTTPKAFAGLYTGEPEDAGLATQRIAEDLYALPWPSGEAPLATGYCTWSNWQDFAGKGNRLHLRPERIDKDIATAAKVGLDLFILDFDWFPRLGDWVTDRERFPEGVRAIGKRIKDAGMLFGLWVGFGQAHPESKVVREHPDWLVTKNGQPTTTGWEMPALCLGYKPCRDWVVAEMSRVIEEYEVEWLKHDFDLIPTSDAYHHSPSATDTRLETIDGYYYIMDELHRRFPKLVLDNWTPALGGADFGTFQRHHSMMMSDWYSAISFRSIQNGMANIFPPSRMHAYLRGFSPAEEASSYHYRSGMFGTGCIVINDIQQWDEATIACVQKEVALQKKYKPLFRAGKIFTLINRQPDHFGWEARFVYAAESGTGMVQVFRNHDAQVTRQICLRGLEAAAEYVIYNIDTDERTTAQTGRVLMETGVAITLADSFSCTTLEVQRL